MRYYVDDWGDELVIRTNADGAEDFKLMTAPANPRRAGRTGASSFPGRPVGNSKPYMAFSRPSRAARNVTTAFQG